jgi:hypothetical protein
MNRAMTVAATGGFGLALVSALGALLAPLGYRLGLWDVCFALLTLVKWVTIASVAAFVVCLLTTVGGWVRRQRAGRGYAYVGLLLSVCCAGVPLYHYAQARRVPALHDITTDTEHPPAFVALAAARATAPNGRPTKALPWRRPNSRHIPTSSPIARRSPLLPSWHRPP